MLKQLKLPAIVLCLLAGTLAIAHPQSISTLGVDNSIAGGGSASTTLATAGNEAGGETARGSSGKLGAGGRATGTPPGRKEPRKRGTATTGTHQPTESGAGPGIHGGDPRQAGPGAR